MVSQHYIPALLRTSLRASAALRGAFLLQAFFMVLNNLIFFTVWWIFFQRFDHIGGWRLPDLAALYGISAFSFGLMLVFWGGVWQLSRMIVEGDLDSLLTQPKNLLVLLLGSWSKPSGWGDMASGAFLLYHSHLVHWHNLPLVVLLLGTSSVVFLASAVIAHSLAFWLGPIDNLSRQLVEFVITFSVYPQTVYPMYIRFFLFTVIPAGFVSFLPVSILREFSWAQLLAVVAGASAYAALALLVFSRGLRRYESGNRFGAKA